ncbi:MAG: hypothetical protein J1F32_01755 [Erysipelotrichales bacterium]|nr:hypothetical protein [Erysipelotrichales bacterium]
MKLFKFLKKLDYRQYLCILITIVFILFSFMFVRSYVRIWESIKDFGLSIYYYFSELFTFKRSADPTINNIGNYDIVNDPFAFLSLESLLIYFKLFFHSIINGENILRYLSSVFNVIYIILKVLLLVMPFFLLIWLLYRNYFSENNKETNSDSVPLKCYKFFKFRIVSPVINWIRSFIDYVRCHRYFIIIWCVIWLLYFNVFTIIIEFLAFYFYFVISFNFSGLFIQFYKLLIDLIPIIRFVPLYVWIIIGVLVFNKIRKNIALSILRHHEMMNRGFINSMGLSSMICSPMGKGKTTLLTDAGLSLNVMFRDKAFELILSNDLKFPNFTFAVFENYIKEAISDHTIYNLATCRKWLSKWQDKFLNDPVPSNLFDYDFEKYGLTYWNGANEITIFEMLENYVQLYFIYVMQSSLLVSNYAIREDSILQDLGHFPMWHSDFFSSNSDYMNAYSRHSHILDFDMLRLGKTIVEDSKYRDAFEFGIVLITEGGKERGNMIDNRGLKKDSEEANQLNDLFNIWVKMMRHSATVDNFPFIKLIFDEQRPESIGADVREVCEKIIFIEEKKDVQTPLMLFRLESMIYEFLNSKFSGLYYNYRFYRSDNTLFMYLLKNIWGKYSHYYERLKYQFSYHQLVLSSKKGTLDETLGKFKYYISWKKIYSRRFATDAFKDYFMEKSSNSEIGLNDIPEFESESASWDELLSSNSYVIIQLSKLRKNLRS